MLKIKKDIIQSGSGIICSESRRSIRLAHNTDDFIRLYFKNYQYLMRVGYPPRDIVDKYFDGINVNNGEIAANVSNISSIDAPLLMWFGSTYGKATYSGLANGRIYLRHDAKMALFVRDNASITVSIYEQSSIYIATYGTSTVRLHIHSDATTVQKSQYDNSKIIIKNG